VYQIFDQNFDILFYLDLLDYTCFAKTSIKTDPTIEENSGIFNPNNNQLTTYIWTILSNGPQCRIRYTISKDICITKKGALGAKCMFFHKTKCRKKENIPLF